MNVITIVNPTSGQGRAVPYIDYIQERLTSAGLSSETVITSKAGDAKEAARQAVGMGAEMVIAAGGDGTINEVLNALCGTSVKMGIIPLGTGNVLARDLKIPLNNIPAACDIIVEGKTHTIDLAKCNDRLFALMAGFGFDAAVVKRVAPQIKDVLGAGAYAFAILGALMRHKASHFTLELDGLSREVDASLVVVANSPSYAYNIRVAPKARMDDGLLDVCVFAKSPSQKLGLLRQAWHVIKSAQEVDPNIIYVRARRVVLESSPEVLIQIDGDAAGKTPAAVEVVSKCLNLVIPGYYFTG